MHCTVLTRCVHRDGFALQPVGGASHAAVNISRPNPEADLDQLEQDEDEMRRANAQVQQMQRRMLDGNHSIVYSLVLTARHPLLTPRHPHRT